MLIASKKRKIFPNRIGFTLVEAMIVITLVGLLAAMVGPPMIGYLQSHRLQTGIDRLVTDLQYTRAQAVSRGRVLRITTTTSSYTITDVDDGTELRQHTLDQGVALAIGQQTNFYPWGMADPTDFDISNKTGAKTISLLPTGIVEVQ